MISKKLSLNKSLHNTGNYHFTFISGHVFGSIYPDQRNVCGIL